MTRRISQTLHIASGRIACTHCNHGIADEGQPWKEKVHLKEVAVSGLPGTGSAVQQHAVLRCFCCPSCGSLLDTETAMPGDPFLDDVLEAVGGAG